MWCFQIWNKGVFFDSSDENWKVLIGVFINILTTKRGPKKIYHLLDVKRNIVTKDEEVWGALFASVFNRKTGFPHGNQLPELVERDEEQNWPPVI